MVSVISPAGPGSFKFPNETLSDVDAEIAARLISTAADIALVLDKDGVIEDLAYADQDLSREGLGNWLGRPWVETVTVESRPKVEEMLEAAASKANPRWRQVNHPSSRGLDLPVRYSAIQLAEGGRVIAIGRDLRPVASLQQRLVEAQIAVEREYARLRQAETRYRLLFQIASEAVLIVDATTQKVVEANPAASHLIGQPVERLVGRGLRGLFAEDAERALQALLAMVRAAGHAEDVSLRLPQDEREFIASASLFRQEQASHFLIRLSPLTAGAAAESEPSVASALIQVVENLPDAFLVTDPDRRVLAANIAFLDLAQMASEEQVRGERLERWLGRHGIELDVLIANLREHGSVRHFRTILRGEYGSQAEVEVAAVSVLEGEQPCFGFVLRDVGARITKTRPFAPEMPRSVDQLTELVGRVPLKELVRETTDVIERLCIEAALELTGDNRASAAEILGLSRQSLYSKLRRYGLVDVAPDDDSSGH
ncbi:transcriptional regulator PpsR [Afifella pfennigii]|uniref:transcriptional regulator PpsR n=1 Tax=Afifella pfennigii TaxID=209897 RepID=UPI00047D7722|nr:transcriptional regulator PpsR [Afifella pfennigii]